MIRPGIGDLISIYGSKKYYYALILSKIRLGGAPLVFAFHQTSAKPLEAAELLRRPVGFHAFIDFIYAKREGRIGRIASRVDITPFGLPKLFKSAPLPGDEPAEWRIWNGEKSSVVRRAPKLSKAERDYPLFQASGDVWMRRHIDHKWRPSMAEVYDT
jgi:hypothetical protein